jgi:DNA repair protein RadC
MGALTKLRARRSKPRPIKVTFSAYTVEEAPMDAPQLPSARTVVNWLAMQGYGSDPREMFVAVTLNQKNRPIKAYLVSIGSCTSTLVHPREVFRAAIIDSAAHIICVHNHPSGDPTPSFQDRDVMLRLKEGGKLLGIDMLDFIITGKDQYYSAQERGDM